jgi:hypothetical protein
MPNHNLKESSEAVQTHLSICQGIIQRMATNSTSCKAWCIALVSAILVVVADKKVPNYVLIAIIPTFLFCVLDAYYLGLERCFRRSYNVFISKVHDKGIETEDLFVMQPTGVIWRENLSALRSFSIWPFYLTLFIVIAIARKILG